jgi:hypothetical protein
MSVAREPVVPPALAALLAPGAPPQAGLTLLLLTAGADGWPHLAMLSVGEVVALDERRLALALWPSSSAAANLAERPRATLAAVVEQTSWTLRVEARAAGTLETPLAGRLARFDAAVTGAASDQAPYAVLEHGVTFSLKDPPAVLARWTQVRKALVDHAP